MPASEAEAVVVGDGIVGLSTAIACADAGQRVTVVGRTRPGIASSAAAGMLAPSIDTPPGSAGDFVFAARDYYPAFLSAVERRTGRLISSDLGGLLELKEPEELTRRTEPFGDATLVSPSDLAGLEPELQMRKDVGALFHPANGWLDNRELLEALRAAAAAHELIVFHETDVVRVDFAPARARVTTSAGAEIQGDLVLLCAGAWTSGIAGLPRPLPVEPVRGQMLAVQGVRARHVLISGDGYAVPRPGGAAYLGSTMERSDFVVANTEEGIGGIRHATTRIAREFGSAVETERWSGLRPITPDLLPIIGRDPNERRLIYATGHGRNGILLAPLTAACVAALATEMPLPADISAFGIERFS